LIFHDDNINVCNDVGKKGAIENFNSWHIFFSVLVNHFMAKQRKPSSKGEKNTENTTNPKRKANGKTANEIVKRHISDKDDKITKEDFENLYIDLSLPKDKAHEPLPIKNKKERPKDADKDNTVTTPWDVISE